jgi:DNA polymerase V
VAIYTSKAAERLRRYGLTATRVKVFAATSRFCESPWAGSVTLSLPVNSNDTTELLYYTLVSVETIYQEKLLYKKAGVVMLKLFSASIRQMALWDGRDRDRYQQLMTQFGERSRNRAISYRNLSSG